MKACPLLASFVRVLQVETGQGEKESVFVRVCVCVCVCVCVRARKRQTCEWACGCASIRIDCASIRTYARAAHQSVSQEQLVYASIPVVKYIRAPRL
jgi:hypothetical protein